MSSETKVLKRITLRAAENQYFHRNRFPHRQKSKFPPTQLPGERERGVNPLAPRRPRGCRGAERPTLVSSETKPSSEQPFAPPKTSISTEAASRIVRNPNSRQPSSRESARGSKPSRTSSPRGCRGAARPTPASSETKTIKRTACIVGNQNPHQNSPGRAREGVNPLDFQSRPATCASDAGADFFGVGACPPEKKSLPCRFRARKSKGFQRNLRKGGAEGNPSPPPPGELERAAALSNFQSKGFPQEIVSASQGGGSGGGACSPVHLTRTACISSSD